MAANERMEKWYTEKYVYNKLSKQAEAEMCQGQLKLEQVKLAPACYISFILHSISWST